MRETERAAHARCAVEIRTWCERSGAEDRPVMWRAGLVDLIQPSRASRTVLVAILASLSRACVSSVTYVQ